MCIYIYVYVSPPVYGRLCLGLEVRALSFALDCTFRVQGVQALRFRAMRVQALASATTEPKPWTQNSQQ